MCCEKTNLCVYDLHGKYINKKAAIRFLSCLLKEIHLQEKYYR